MHRSEENKVSSFPAYLDKQHLWPSSWLLPPPLPFFSFCIKNKNPSQDVSVPLHSSKCIFTDSHSVISRQHQTTPVDSGSNPPRREAEPKNDTLGREFHFQMIVKMVAANMVLQAMAKPFTEQLQRMFHTSWYPPLQAKTPLRGQSICPAAPFLLTQTMWSIRCWTECQETTISEETIK